MAGPDALDRYDHAIDAFQRTGDRAALARDLFALGVAPDQIERIATGEKVVAISAESVPDEPALL